MKIDKGKLYKDGFLKISDDIKLIIPTVGEIFDMTEQKYFSIITTLCSNAFDYKWQLYEQGLDFTKIDDYDMFITFIAPTLSSNETSILFGDTLNFKEMKVVSDKRTGEKKLIQILDDNVIIFDRVNYFTMAETLRDIHNLKRSFVKYKNEITKIAEIEDSKMYYERHKNDEYKPYLFNLVSAMVNYSGFPRNDKTVWDMNIFAFMDSVKRIQKESTAKILLQSGYSGFGISLKDIDKKELDWLGEI